MIEKIEFIINRKKYEKMRNFLDGCHVKRNNTETGEITLECDKHGKGTRKILESTKRDRVKTFLPDEISINLGIVSAKKHIR